MQIRPLVAAFWDRLETGAFDEDTVDAIERALADLVVSVLRVGIRIGMAEVAADAAALGVNITPELLDGEHT